MDLICVIVVHYNSDKDTQECLKSLAKINTQGFKVRTIVVDNGSSAQLQLKGFGLSNTEVIRSSSNLGFTGGNNLGITYARQKYEPDYFLLLNNDTHVDKNFLYFLHKRAKQSQKTGLISPKIYFAKGYEYHKKSYAKSDLGKVIWFAGGSVDWPNILTFHRGVDEVDRTQFDNQLESDFNTGCCLLIPRKIIETVGLLDKNYFLYLEDVDYNLRVKKLGYEIVFEPQSLVWHKNASSSGGAGNLTSIYYQTRNRLYFALKHGGWRVKATTIKLLFKSIFDSKSLPRKAAWDLVLGRMGKQTVV